MMKRKTNFFKQNTKIKNFIPLPRFILAEDISSSAKLIYGLLIARTMVSQKEENADKWSDTVGNIYIMYTIQNLAKDSGLSAGAVKKAMEQLRAAGLVQTIKHGNNKPNTIFVKYPEGAFKETEEAPEDSYVIKIIHPEGRQFTKDDFEEAGRSMDGPDKDHEADDRQMTVNCQSNDRHQKVSLREDTFYPSGRTESDPPESHNMTPIYTDINNKNKYTDMSEMEPIHVNQAGINRLRAITKATAERLPKANI